MFKQGMVRAAGVVLAGVLWCAVALAEPVRVEGAWARATVPGQQVGGVYMTLTAADDSQLLGGASPAARAVEVHEMVMDGDVMRMRPMDALALPAGRAVELRPGGLHLMLIDLKAPLVAGASVPLTLRLRDAGGAESLLELQVPVRAAAAGAGGHGSAHSR